MFLVELKYMKYKKYEEYLMQGNCNRSPQEVLHKHLREGDYGPDFVKVTLTYVNYVCLG